MTKKNYLWSSLTMIALFLALFTSSNTFAQCDADVGTPPNPGDLCVAVDDCSNPSLLNEYDGQTGATDFVWLITDLNSIYTEDDTDEFDGPRLVGFSYDGTFDGSVGCDELGVGNYGFTGLAFSQSYVDGLLCDPGTAAIISALIAPVTLDCGDSLEDVYFALLSTALFDDEGISIERLVNSITDVIPGILGTDPACLDMTDNPYYTVTVVDDASECPFVCAADYGTVAAPAMTTVAYGDSIVPPTVIPVAGAEYAQVYVVTTDIDPTDDVTYDIVGISLDGGINTLDYFPGEYNVHALNILIDDIAALQTALGDGSAASGEDVLAMIDGGMLCAALDVPGYMITITCDAVGGAISTMSETTICVGDGTDDTVSVDVDDAGMGDNSFYLITDGDATVVLGVAEGTNDITFSTDTPEGVCLIWHVNYTGGSIPDWAQGDDINFFLFALGCFDVSDPIAVTRVSGEDCPEVEEPATIMFTLNVNMENETVSDDGVFLAGGLWFGNPGDNELTDPDGDGIYSITIEVPADSVGYYTITNGACPDYSCKENIAGQDCANPDNFNDRIIITGTEDIEVSTCFSFCSEDGSCPEPVEPVDVTFQVCMDGVDVAESGVFMGAGFDGWSGGIMLSDDDGDNVWTVTISLEPGTYEYKFINGAVWADGGETLDPMEDADCTLTTGEFTNRIIEVTEAMTTPAYAYGSCDECEDEPTCEAMASVISTESETTVCVGDGEADEVMVMSEGGMGSNSAIIISDGTGEVILGVITDGSNPNFDGAPAGTCLIWELYYEGDLPEVEAGVTLVADALGMIECSAISNSIEVVREDCEPTGPFANAGTVTAPEDTEIDDVECVSGEPTVEGAYDGEGYSYAYVLTTDLDPEDDFMFDIIDINSTGSFDLCSYGLPVGTMFNVHGLSFEGDLDGLLGLVDLGGITTGEQAAGAIAAGLIDADLIIPGYQLSFVEETCSSFVATAVQNDCSDAQETAGTYSVTVTLEGGEGPYFIEGSFNEEEFDGDTFELIDLVDQTDYYVEITDANGCEQVVAGSGFCAKCQISLDVSADCNEAGDAYDVFITINNGTAPYSIAGTYNDAAYNSDVLEINGITAGDEYTVVITDSEGCSVEASGSEDCKLNVDLLKFEGATSELGNTLTWETATEENSNYFTLERSTNGVDFETVGNIDAAGNSNTAQFYSFLDNRTQSCVTYYYRLSETNYNGETRVISDIVRLTNGTDCLEVSVMPVPAISEVNVEFTTVEGVASISIYDVVGRVISTQDVDTNEGLNNIIIDLNNYAAGTYFIAIVSGDKVATTKFVKK